VTLARCVGLPRRLTWLHCTALPFISAVELAIASCTADLTRPTSACSSVRRQGKAVQSTNPRRSASSSAAAVPPRLSILLLDAVRPDEARSLLPSSMLLVITRPLLPRLRQLMFAIGRPLRHRLEAEKEPSHWHWHPRVCFPPRAEPLHRWRLYFASYLHIYFAIHASARCIPTPMTNNPSLPPSHPCFAPVARPERPQPSSHPTAPHLFSFLSTISIPPANTQLQTLPLLLLRQECCPWSC
jgi:hypothetical protein